MNEADSYSTHSNLLEQKILINYHIPKTGGSTLLTFFKKQSHCKLFDIRDRVSYISALEVLYEHNYGRVCTIFHIHAGTAPSFMQSVNTLSGLSLKFGARNVKIFVVMRNPLQYYLSYYNFVCVIQKNCGKDHEHTLENFKYNAPGNLQSKYLLYGHSGGWKSASSRCPYTFESLKRAASQSRLPSDSCSVRVGDCNRIQDALKEVDVVKTSNLEIYVDELIREFDFTPGLVHEKNTSLLMKDKRWRSGNSQLRLEETNIERVFEKKVYFCDNEIYSRSEPKSPAMRS